MAWSGGGDVSIFAPAGSLTGTSRWIIPASTARAARTAGGAIGDAGADEGGTALMGITSIGCSQWGQFTRIAVARASVWMGVSVASAGIALLIFREPKGT
jgi:hypothetical protein